MGNVASCRPARLRRPGAQHGGLRGSRPPAWLLRLSGPSTLAAAGALNGSLAPHRDRSRWRQRFVRRVAAVAWWGAGPVLRRGRRRAATLRGRAPSLGLRVGVSWARGAGYAPIGCGCPLASVSERPVAAGAGGGILVLDVAGAAERDGDVGGAVRSWPDLVHI